MSDPSTRSWYFVTKTASVLGPLDEVKLADMLAEKELTPQSLVWNGCAATKWTRLINVPGLLPRLRRKSRGFSQLRTVLRRISEAAIDPCSTSLSFIVSYMAATDTDESGPLSSTEAVDGLSLSSDINTDEMEEKRPVLSPRPLESLESEKSENASGFNTSGYITVGSESLIIPRLTTSKSPDHFFGPDKTHLSQFSEEPLSLNGSDFRYLTEDCKSSRGQFSPTVDSEVSLDPMTFLKDGIDTSPESILTPIPRTAAATPITEPAASAVAITETAPPPKCGYFDIPDDDGSELKLATDFRMKQRQKKKFKVISRYKTKKSGKDISAIVISDDSSLSLQLSLSSSSRTSSSSSSSSMMPAFALSSYSFGTATSDIHITDE